MAQSADAADTHAEAAASLASTAGSPRAVGPSAGAGVGVTKGKSDNVFFVAAGKKKRKAHPSPESAIPSWSQVIQAIHVPNQPYSSDWLPS